MDFFVLELISGRKEDLGKPEKSPESLLETVGEI